MKIRNCLQISDSNKLQYTMHTGVIQSNKLSYKTKIFLIPLKSNFFSFKIIHEEDSQVRITTSISRASGSYVTATYCTRRRHSRFLPMPLLQPPSDSRSPHKPGSILSSYHENWICWTPEIC